MLLIDDTTFGSASEGLILARNKLYIHPSSKKTITVELSSVKKVHHNKNKLSMDDAQIFSPSSPDSKDIIKFYTLLHLFIHYDVYEKMTVGTDIAKSSIEIETEKSFADNITSLAGDTISKVGWLAPVLVVLFKYYTPDKVFNLISQFPVVGTAGFIGKLILGPPLEKFHSILLERGEGYVMEKAVMGLKNQKISPDYVIQKINNIHAMILSDQEKNEAIEILNKYYCSLS